MPYVSFESLGIQAPLHARGNVQAVICPYPAFKFYLAINVEDQKQVIKLRGTYLGERDAEKRGEELQKEACKQGFKQFKNNSWMWTVQKPSYVIACCLREISVKAAGEYCEYTDWKYTQTKLEEDAVEDGVEDDDLTG